jgi:flagellar hook-length control protein FliK
MKQTISAASGGNTQSKAFESAGLFKMTDASSEKVKSTSTESGKDEKDVNNQIPFLQLLNQQITRTNKLPDDDASSSNKENVVREQTTLLLLGNVTLTELPPAKIAPAKSEETIGNEGEQSGQTGLSVNALLKEIDLLKTNLATGDVKGGALSPSTALEETGAEENFLAGENKGADAITDALGQEITAKFDGGKTEQINDKNLILSQLGGITGQKDEKKLFIADEPRATGEINMAVTDSKKTLGLKTAEAQAGNVSLQLPTEDSSAEKEAQLKASETKKESILKTGDNPLPVRKMILSEDQISKNALSKMSVNFVDVKQAGKENESSNDNLSIQAEKDDSAVGSNSRLSTQEMKESLINKDNFRFAEEKYSNTANSKAENKAQTETMQAVLAEVSGKIKTEQKEKTIFSEKGKEEISLSSVNAAVGSASASVEKINDVSFDKIIGQITSEIKETAANDGGRVKITLDPPSLGKLEMDVTVRNSKVEVILVADNKDVQQALNTHIDKLKGGLQNQGLTIDRCDVFMQDKRDEYQQNFNRQAFYQESGSRQNGNGRQGNSEEKVTLGAIASGQSGSISGVSMDNISLFA